MGSKNSQDDRSLAKTLPRLSTPCPCPLHLSAVPLTADGGLPPPQSSQASSARLFPSSCLSLCPRLPLPARPGTHLRAPPMGRGGAGCLPDSRDKALNPGAVFPAPLPQMGFQIPNLGAHIPAWPLFDGGLPFRLKPGQDVRSDDTGLAPSSRAFLPPLPPAVCLPEWGARCTPAPPCCQRRVGTGFCIKYEKINLTSQRPVSRML